MDLAKVAQMVNVLNGLTARDALCLLVGCMLTVLDEAPSDEERQQSLDSCIDLLRCTKDRLRPLCTGVNYVQFGLDEAGCGGFTVIPRRLIGTWLDIVLVGPTRVRGTGRRCARCPIDGILDMVTALPGTA